MKTSRIKQLLPLVGKTRAITKAKKGIGNKCHVVVLLSPGVYSGHLCEIPLDSINETGISLLPASETIAREPNKALCKKCLSIFRELDLIYNDKDCQRMIFHKLWDKEFPDSRNMEVNIAPAPIEVR